MRRRAYLLSLSVATLATLFFLTWLASESYEATAVVRVPPPPGGSHSEHLSLFDRVRATEMAIINMALGDPEIANCPTLRNEVAKDLWVQKRMSVELIGDEFIRFTLRGDDPDDVAAILDAVMEAAIEQQRDDRREDLYLMKAFAELEKARLRMLGERAVESEDSVERQLLQMEFEQQAERVARLEDQVFWLDHAGQLRPQVIQRAAVPQESLLKRILRRIGF